MGITMRVCEDSDSRLLVQRLLNAEVLGHRIVQPEVIETHISFVLLTGPFAYKLRKPIVLPFLDFRTLESRRVDCEKELELNRRWAPELYLQVIAVRGRAQCPRLDGGGEVIEYAVQMRQFPQSARLDHIAAAKGLDDAVSDALACCVSQLHQQSPVARADSPFARPDVISEQVIGNFDTLDTLALDDSHRRQLDTLREYCEQQVEKLLGVFLARLSNGMVRECHGDLHLANLIWWQGQVMPFDGVSFRADFRWVDVMSDLSFLLMDMHRLQCVQQARRVLDHWLQSTGDRDALQVVRLYLVYRALIRAKVAALRYHQLRPRADADSNEAREAMAGVETYLQLATRLMQPSAKPVLIITHGLSASGKSWLARQLVEAMGAVCVRSDVERRRLHPQAKDRYAPHTTEQVYRHLISEAERVLSAEFPVILDATFLRRRWRESAMALAERLAVPMRILALHAPREVLMQRIDARLKAATDPSEADKDVLTRQFDALESLTEHEQQYTIDIESGAAIDPKAVIDSIYTPKRAPSCR